MKNQKVRVRFAPSPTGPLHMGGLRTALFNYLFARQHSGVFILRIEDTDLNRFVPGAEEYIMESLEWCGIEVDEGVKKGGPFAPYRQSERKEFYREHAGMLVHEGKAYYAFDLPEELEAKREEAKRNGQENFQYDLHSRMQMRNSLTMDQAATKQWLASGKPYVIRFRIPENRELHFHDIIRGEVSVDSNTLDDKVLYKSDGMPTYHLANIVDDYLMEISHVIRGEEWLPSLPLHILIYEAFGWEPPVFAHLPLLLKPSGQGKLSKRDGDKMGFPVFPLEWNGPDGETAQGYRESGYYPEAFVNILAMLGWNPGTDQEIFSMEELIRAFSIERVNKSGARFDPEKARWYNHHYLQQRPAEILAAEFKTILGNKGIRTADDRLVKLVNMVKERLSFVHEMWNETWFFFRAPEQYDEQVVKKRWNAETPGMMKKVRSRLEGIHLFTAAEMEHSLKSFMEEEGLGMGQVMNALRLAVVGTLAGPGMFDICEWIGKEETLRRIDRAIATIRV